MNTKYNLTRSEEFVQSANRERLKSAGIPVAAENSVSLKSPGLRVRQGERSSVMAYVTRGFVAEICVTLIPMKSGIILRDYCGITLPGCEELSMLVSRPVNGSCIYKAFEFSEYAEVDVLNHYFLSGRSLPCDRALYGILLVYSFDSFPNQFQRGAVSAKITLLDEIR